MKQGCRGGGGAKHKQQSRIQTQRGGEIGERGVG